MYRILFRFDPPEEGEVLHEARARVHTELQDTAGHLQQTQRQQGSVKFILSFFRIKIFFSFLEFICLFLFGNLVLFFIFRI